MVWLPAGSEYGKERGSLEGVVEVQGSARVGGRRGECVSEDCPTKKTEIRRTGLGEDSRRLCGSVLEGGNIVPEDGVGPGPKLLGLGGENVARKASSLRAKSRAGGERSTRCQGPGAGGSGGSPGASASRHLWLGDGCVPRGPSGRQTGSPGGDRPSLGAHLLGGSHRYVLSALHGLWLESTLGSSSMRKRHSPDSFNDL